MTPQIHLRLFFGTRVRLIQERPGGMIFVPIADLAAAVSHRRTSVMRLIQRHEETFNGEVFSVNLIGRHHGALCAASVNLVGGQISPLRAVGEIVPFEPPFIFENDHGTWSPKRLACLSWQSAIWVVVILEASRIRDPERRARIVKFQRWARAVVARESLKLPRDAMPIDLADLAGLNPGREMHAAVLLRAETTGGSPRHIYRKLHRLRVEEGLRVRQERSDRDEVRQPLACRTVAEFLQGHPHATERELEALNTGLCRTTLYRLMAAAGVGI
jgi:hypothetical protein